MNNEVTSLPELPKGWVWTRLGEITSVMSGGTPDTKDALNFGGDVVWITPADLSGWDDKYISHGVRNITDRGLKSSSAVLLPKGSVIFSSRAPIGYVAIAATELCTNQGFKNFIPFDGLYNEYLYYYLKASKSLAESFASGTTFSELSASRAANLPVPFPPTPEQRRIVTKIEELFTRLDAGVESLKKIKAQLKRYRQSVLKHAFEGKLTAEWRETHRDELEPASILLEGIKEGRKGNAKGKFKELPPLNTSDLPELPEGWVWARFNQVCSKIQDGSHFSPKIQFDEPGKDRYLYITAKNIRDDGLDLSNVTYVDSNFYRFAASRCDPQINDVLLIKDGVKTGTLTVNNLREQFCILSSVSILRCNADSVNPHFISYYLKSPLGYTMISGAMTGTAIRRIILDKIRQSYLPIASKNEQDKIVVEIERRFSVADEIEKTVDHSLKQAERLRHSILKRSFEGKLVPQDPNDEPVEKLLERIKADRAKHLTEAKASSKSKKKTHTKQMRLV